MGHCSFIGGGVTEMSFVESGATQGIPLSAQEGDLFVLVDRVSDTTVTQAAIAGFNQIMATLMVQSSSQEAVTTYWRKIEAGDAGTSLSGQGNSGSGKLLLWALFRPDNEIDTITIADAQSAVDQGAIQSLTAHADGEPTPVLAFGVGSRLNTDPLLTSDPTEDGSIQVGLRTKLAWSIFNAAPVDVEYATNSGVWATLQSFLLKVE